MEQKLGFGELVWKKATTWVRRLGMNIAAWEKVRAGVDMEEGTDEPGQTIKIRNGEGGTKHTEGTEDTLVAVSVSSKIYSHKALNRKTCISSISANTWNSLVNYIYLIQHCWLRWKSTVAVNHLTSAEEGCAGDSEFPSRDEQLHQCIVRWIFFLNRGGVTHSE